MFNNRIEIFNADRTANDTQMTIKLNALDIFAQNLLNNFQDFIKQSHYNQSVIKELSEEESIVESFIKYYGDQYDKARDDGITFSRPDTPNSDGTKIE